MIPGVVATWPMIWKRRSPNILKFGTGVIEGGASVEANNNGDAR
jgi:hypothetical protein